MYDSRVAQLQAAMMSPKDTYLATGSLLGRLVEMMIREQRYVCSPALWLQGMGGFERGLYARVRCLGHGSAQYDYRLEMWADGETFMVRPWIEGLDEDTRG